MLARHKRAAQKGRQTSWNRRYQRAQADISPRLSLFTDSILCEWDNGRLAAMITTSDMEQVEDLHCCWIIVQRQSEQPRPPEDWSLEFSWDDELCQWTHRMEDGRPGDPLGVPPELVWIAQCLWRCIFEGMEEVRLTPRDNSFRIEFR